MEYNVSGFFQMSAFYEDRTKVEALRDAMLRRIEVFPVVENIFTYNEVSRLPHNSSLECMSIDDIFS